MFTPKQLSLLSDLRSRFLTQKPGAMQALRTRFERTDRYIQRTVGRFAEDAEGMAAARLGDRSKIRNFEIPIVLQHLDTMHSRLVGIFLTGVPLFPAIAVMDDEVSQSAADALSALVERDQEHFNWVSNLKLSLLDSLRYHCMFCEVEWATTKISTVGVEAGSSGGLRAGVSVQYEGNSIKRLDPYNTFRDATVPLSKLHSDGAYAGYVERMNYISTKRYLAGLNEEFAVYQNFSTALTNGVGAISNLYFIPDVRPLETNQRKADENWEAFFGVQSMNAKLGAQGRYEKVVMYVRIVPSEYEIRGKKSGTPAIFKLVWIGTTLVYVEPLQNAHGWLPIFAAHANDDGNGFESFSFAENLQDVQDTGTALLNGAINSMRRAVSDRAIYNPLLLDPKDVLSANPVAKMALKPSAYQSPMDNAYKQIPYEDRISALLTNNMTLVQGMSYNITGLNPSAQGTFVPGNKTREEYSSTMNNSDARGQKLALDIDSSFFTPVKRALKMNYMQFAKMEEVLQPSKRATVKIDPTVLLSTETAFKMADGLFPSAMITNSAALGAAFNTIAQNQDLNMEFNLGKVFAAILRAQGVDVSAYQRTPAEKAQLQQQQLQLAAAQAGAAPGAVPAQQPPAQ